MMNKKSSVLTEWFKTCEIELFYVAPSYFIIALLLNLGLYICLSLINLWFLSSIIAYPIFFIILLAIYNFKNRIVISAEGTRQTTHTLRNKTRFPLEKVIGARKIKFIYDANLSIEENINNIMLRKEKINPNSEIIYYGIVSIPYNALLGYLIGSEQEYHIYNYDRTKSLWEDITIYDEKPEIMMKKTPYPSSEKVNALLSLSFDINPNSVVDFNRDTIEFSLKDSKLDKKIDYTHVIDYVLRKLVEYKEIDFYIAANNGFVFYLGTRLSDSNIPESRIFEYSGDPKTGYTYCINLKTKDIINFK